MKKANYNAQESGDLGECYVIEMLSTKWKHLMPFEVKTVQRHKGCEYDIDVNDGKKIIRLETKRSKVDARSDNHLFGKSLTFINEHVGYIPTNVAETENILKSNVFCELFLNKNDYIMFWKEQADRNTIIVLDNATMCDIITFKHINRVEGYFLEFNDFFRLKLRSNRVQCCFGFTKEFINFLRDHALSFYEWKK